MLANIAFLLVYCDLKFGLLLSYISGLWSLNISASLSLVSGFVILMGLRLPLEALEKD